MMLRYSKDDKISENPPEVCTLRKWNAEEEVNEAIRRLRHQDIIGSTQTVRSGLGGTQFKPFSQSNAKERRDAVVKEVRQVEQESRYVHLVRCSQQGQCLRWEEKVIERRLNWKEIWEWEPARLSFLLKSTYDMLPKPANLVR